MICIRIMREIFKCYIEYFNVNDLSGTLNILSRTEGRKKLEDQEISMFLSGNFNCNCFFKKNFLRHTLVFEIRKYSLFCLLRVCLYKKER